MPRADAVMMMFSTMGLGAFTPHDRGVAYWNSPLIEATIALFVLLAGINFSLHFIAFRKRSPRAYWRDSEVRAYLAVILGVALAVACFLWWRDVYPDFVTDLRYAAFNTISLATTSGYASTDYAQWPALAPVLMLV